MNCQIISRNEFLTFTATRSGFSGRFLRMKSLMRSKSTEIKTVAIRQMMLLSNMLGRRLAMPVMPLTILPERLVTALPRLEIMPGSACSMASTMDASNLSPICSTQL